MDSLSALGVLAATFSMGVSDCHVAHMEWLETHPVRVYYDETGFRSHVGDISLLADEISGLVIDGGTELPRLKPEIEGVVSLSLQSSEWSFRPKDHKFFSDLASLRFLSITNNEVDSFPFLVDILADSNVCSLTIRANSMRLLELGGECVDGLERLEVFSRNLTDIDSSIAELSDLEDLLLGTGKLESLPKEIKNMEGLRFLAVLGNRLHAESGFFLPYTLEVLYLPANRLKRVPEEFRELQNLRELDLSRNPISAIPEWIAELENLEGLFLRLSDVDELPLTLLELQNIKQIDLSGSKVKEVPVAFEEWIEEGILLIGD